MSQKTTSHWYWRSRRSVEARNAEREARKADNKPRRQRRYLQPKAPALVPGWNELAAIANDAETVRVVRDYLARHLARKRKAA